MFVLGRYLQALNPMATYTAYWLPAKEAVSVSVYYLTISAQICERLGTAKQLLSSLVLFLIEWRWWPASCRSSEQQRLLP